MLQPKHVKLLTRYVPHRLIRPFFAQELRGVKDSEICSFTVIPALCAYFLKSDGEHRHPVLDPLTRGYERLIRQLIRQPILVNIYPAGLDELPQAYRRSSAGGWPPAEASREPS